MARYKAKSTVGKAVENLASVTKVDGTTGWGVSYREHHLLPTLAVNADGAITEARTVKLRREAGETYDAILRHVDKVTEFGRLADVPTEDVLAQALAAWARELLGASA